MSGSERKSVRQELPPATQREENVRDRAFPLVSHTAYEVCSWRPGPAGSGEPCTEVHLLLPPIEGFQFGLRLKSARALDELVGVLLEHRKDVWGPK